MMLAASAFAQAPAPADQKYQPVSVMLLAKTLELESIATTMQQKIEACQRDAAKPEPEPAKPPGPAK